MWIPESEKEIVDVVTSGSLEESVTFDAKAELPSKRRNHELAKDVAAMATEGGVLLYGVAEDEHGRPTSLTPIPLAGQPERIAAIVRTSIAEPPFIRISQIATADDPSKGYIVVVVPPSERAPHMVVVKGDHRYYGRTDTGNRLLSEAEVARLYERRRQAKVDVTAMLADDVETLPYPRVDALIPMYLIARPVLSNESLLKSAARDHGNPQTLLHRIVDRAVQPSVFPNNQYMPDMHFPDRWFHQPEGFLGRMGWVTREDESIQERLRTTLDLRVNFDGTIRFYCGAVGEANNEMRAVFATAIAGLTTRFLAFAGRLYEEASYLGGVDVGVAMLGLKGGVPGSPNVIMIGRLVPLERDTYYQAARLSAFELADDPREAARSLLGPLFNTLFQGSRDPLATKQ